jgi:hypothetical protein
MDDPKKKSKEERDKETAERRAAKAEQVKINRAERALKVEQLRKEKAELKKANKLKPKSEVEKQINNINKAKQIEKLELEDEKLCLICLDAVRTHTQSTVKAAVLELKNALTVELKDRW